MFSTKLINLHHKTRFAIVAYSNAKSCDCFASYTTVFGERSVHRTHHPFGVVRLLNTSSVVPPQITRALDAAAPVLDNTPNLNSLISSIGPIPEAPATPLPPVIELLPNGEPSLASLGLDSWWPNGLFQKALEFIHVTGDVPWWASIVIVTAIVRIVLFPVVVKQLKANIHFGNNMPQFAILQSKLTNARAMNDHLSAARYGLELQELMKEKKISPFTVMKFAWVQGFVLISFTSGLRGMCALPVESLFTGGCLHVLDLTATDGTYLLPLANAVMVFVNLKLGVDVPKTLAQNPNMVIALRYGIPTVVFFTASFMYNSIGIYWLSTAVIAFFQNRLVRLPAVRNYLQIPAEIKSDVMKQLQETSKSKRKSIFGFYDNFKQGMENSRVANEVKNRAEIDELAFERAGREPIRKTYKFNPKELASKK